MHYRLGVIGAGNMGFAVVHGALSQGVLRAPDVLIIEPDPARRERAAASGCAVREHIPPDFLAQCEQIMLAVKPQVFPAIAKALQGAGTTSRVVISIMAGIPSDRIRAALGDWARVVRVMPNLPCMIGEGVSAISLGAPGTGATEDDSALAHELFSALGAVVRVEEAQMYAVTAVSGSGPAYIYLLAEAMQQAAEQMGLAPPAARELVMRTISGAGAMLRAFPEKTAATLRQEVTSPGGTTAAALQVMFEKKLPEIVVEALLAARARGEELGNPPSQ